MAKLTRLHVFNLGNMEMDKSRLVSGMTVATRDNPNCPAEFVRFPVSAFLIEHKDGLILYDAGCHPDSMGEHGHWSPFQQERNPFYGRPEDNLLVQLKGLGYGPADIDIVVLSHMHNDHAGCLEFFHNPVVYVHEDEFAAAMRDYATGNPESPYVFKDMDGWLGKIQNWRFLPRNSGEYYLTSGITIHNFGSGHSHGMLGLEVELENSGNILLVSDSIYSKDNFHPNFILPGALYDSVGTRATAERIYQHQRKKHSLVLFGHDPEQIQKIKTAPADYYE